MRKICTLIISVKNFLFPRVYEPEITYRDVSLPKGCGWINYWTGESHEGGETIQADTPIKVIPVYVKKGAIKPMRENARNIEMGTNDFLDGIVAKTHILQKVNEDAFFLISKHCKGIMKA